ncbi:hypothetical protein GCM10018773_61360 [Streptomyces candidus]|nr:hypothetical protein GCM10018773_61360 [Streptomyces candidus]
MTAASPVPRSITEGPPGALGISEGPDGCDPSGPSAWASKDLDCRTCPAVVRVHALRGYRF